MHPGIKIRETQDSDSCGKKEKQAGDGKHDDNNIH
jgi:hypothetical protein